MLYQTAKDNIGKPKGIQSLDKYTDSAYLLWKRKVHEEFYKLIREAGIIVEGA